MLFTRPNPEETQCSSRPAPNNDGSHLHAGAEVKRPITTQTKGYVEGLKYLKANCKTILHCNIEGCYNR